MVSEQPEWAQGDTWTGNSDANHLTGICKPAVLEVLEWDEGYWRRQRAEVMTLLPGTPCARADVLRTEAALSQRWWAELRRSIDRLRRTPTARINTDQARIDQRVRTVVGSDVQVRVDQWDTVHGDVHWTTCSAPEFALLDWELWGRGPAGTDPATLLSYSLLVPATAEQVHTTFADLLDTLAGRIAQIVVAARLLTRATNGDHPELVEPLHRHARTLIDS